MIALLIFCITNSLTAADVPQASVAPAAPKSAGSSFNARKERARKKQEAEQKKHEARLEKARRRVEAKGLIPKTKRKVQESTETAPIEAPPITASFAHEIETIINSYMKSDAHPKKPLDPDYYDVIWDESASTLEDVIKELETLEAELSQAVQKAKTAKTFAKLKDKDQIQDALINVESFADDTYQFDSEGNPVEPYVGVKKPYKNRLQALSNNISNIRAELF